MTEYDLLEIKYVIFDHFQNQYTTRIVRLIPYNMEFKRINGEKMKARLENHQKRKFVMRFGNVIILKGQVLTK